MQNTTIFEPVILTSARESQCFFWESVPAKNCQFLAIRNIKENFRNI